MDYLKITNIRQERLKLMLSLYDKHRRGEKFNIKDLKKRVTLEITITPQPRLYERPTNKALWPKNIKQSPSAS